MTPQRGHTGPSGQRSFATNSVATSRSEKYRMASRSVFGCFAGVFMPTVYHILVSQVRYCPNLTLTRTQYLAIVCNAGNRKPLIYTVFANRCNAQQPMTAHS